MEKENKYLGISVAVSIFVGLIIGKLFDNCIIAIVLAFLAGLIIDRMAKVKNWSKNLLVSSVALDFEPNIRYNKYCLERGKY